MQKHIERKFKLRLYSDAGNLPMQVGTVINLASDAQAEQRVLEITRNVKHQRIDRWVLEDEKGERCTWELSSDGSGLPIVTRRSSRFEGNSDTNPNEVLI